ncbi:hypothetical protein BDK51DRAFT_31817 [Blyttiomyces helicus]|uniref:Uncharacterized protein n=1 Tax=Blyttiomyces helicus TaxID=388810 RepID=A0A4P9WFQ2_9FUNG|nr:hypothetical protein BDK51DRAFT_31817 [Blyttiomyces helicus]|eukprot:RKO89840.1 hypothetical protein BDK51DRAFT_31817 [Blyttiomyces helicus]
MGVSFKVFFLVFFGIRSEVAAEGFRQALEEVFAYKGLPYPLEDELAEAENTKGVPLGHTASEDEDSAPVSTSDLRQTLTPSQTDRPRRPPNALIWSGGHCKLRFGANATVPLRVGAKRAMGTETLRFGVMATMALQVGSIRTATNAIWSVCCRNSSLSVGHKNAATLQFLAFVARPPL